MATYHKLYLQLISVSFLRFQSHKNVKVEARSEYHNENTQPKDSIPRTRSKVLQEFRKIHKIARRVSISTFSGKL